MENQPLSGGTNNGETKGPWNAPDRATRQAIRDHKKARLRPEDLKGVRWDLPCSLDVFEVVGSFDERGRRKVSDPDQAIGCAMNPGHRPFQVHVLWFPDGYLRFVGRTCGSKHFALSAKSLDAAVAAYREIAKREIRQLLLDGAAPLLAPAVAAVQNLRDSPQVAEATRIEGMIGRRAPEVGAAWHFAGTHDGVLSRQGMTTQRSIFRQAGGGGRYGDVERVSYGRVDGLEFAMSGKACRLMLDLALGNLKEAAEMLRKGDTDAMSDEEQARVLRMLHEGVKGARRAQEAVEALPRLFSQKAVAQVVGYINGEANHKRLFDTYELIPGGFRRNAKDGSSVDVAFRSDKRKAVDLADISRLADEIVLTL